MAEDNNADEVAESVEYSLNDWENIWKDKSSHKNKPVSEQLVRYSKDILPRRGNVFLPLCGQSPDLRWLYDSGHSVVGLDGVEAAIKILVEKNSDLEFRRELTDAATPIYKSQDGRMELHVADILDSHVRRMGPFDAVYDYGAYTAIKPSDRQRYVHNVLATLKSDYRYFVEFCHDVSKEFEYGPCVISFQRLKREFGLDKKLRFLETIDASSEWGAKTFFNTSVLIMPPDRD